MSDRSKGRAEGLREAARMVAAKSDLIRGTRGGITKATTELDFTVRDLLEAADKAEKATFTEELLREQKELLASLKEETEDNERRTANIVKARRTGVQRRTRLRKKAT